MYIILLLGYEYKSKLNYSSFLFFKKVNWFPFQLGLYLWYLTIIMSHVM